MSNNRKLLRCAITVIAVAAFAVIASCQVINTGDSICQPPTFSPAGGAYSTGQSVTLSTTTSGASIFYTTDGSAPTASSTLYTAPIAVDASMTINAIAAKDTLANSTIVSAAYEITPFGLASFAFANPAAVGAIDGASVIVTVPYNTDRTALIPTISHTGASISPESGVAQDFTAPVTYTVTAADGATKSFVVTVAYGFTSWRRFSHVDNGLGSDLVYNVYSNGSRLCAATSGGISYTDNLGSAWSNFDSENTPAVFTNDTVRDVMITGLQIYAATQGGGIAFRLTNSSDWTAITNLPSSTVYGLYVAGTGGTTNIYAVTASGLSISANNGTSWTNLTTAQGLQANLRSIDVSGSTICAGSTSGITVSLDGGTTWNGYTSANGLGSGQVYDIYVSGTTIYAATGGGLSVSMNGGLAWNNYTNFTNSAEVGDKVVRDVYVYGSTIYIATFRSLSISTDACASWTNYTTSELGVEATGFLSIFADKDRVYVGTASSGLLVGQ